MGYDMYVVDDCGDAVGGPGSTLRRNVWGGRRLADRLIEVGMGYWPTGEAHRPEMPDVPPGISWDGDTQRWVGPGSEDHTAVEHAHLKATWDERPGISVYKLCGSNDDWWVTRIECSSALDLWERAGRPDVADGLGDVIPFLQLAARHAGFRVG